MRCKTKVLILQSNNDEPKLGADMDHASFIIASYVLTFASIAVYVLYIVRRSRRLGAITSDDDKPWI
ncbi:MAG: heme exporter protein CcmD [Ilumatobacteraceae bacterium]|nr:heme exporter protein CcmD [Ilumatobacteraceae bacterium]